MKSMNVFLVMFVTLCIVLPVGAQVNLGVLGGLNMANVSIDPLAEEMELSNLIVFGFGGVLDYNLNEFITLHLEPMYLQKGVKGKWHIYELENTAAYIEIPVMLKYAFGSNEIKPYVMAGPSIGDLLSAEGKVSGGGYSETEDMKDDTKSFDFGLGFGAGVSVPMSKNSIFLEARYVLGLTNVNDDSDAPDTVVKTKGIQIFAGITFPLGGK